MKINAESLLKYRALIQQLNPIRINGKVTQVIGLTVESHGPDVKIGDCCMIYPKGDEAPVLSEVVGFRESKVLLMPLGDLGAVGPGCDVVATGKPFQVKVGRELLGRVLDGNGKPIDHLGTLQGNKWVRVDQPPPNPLDRPRITEPISVGIRAIDGLLTVGKGQRIGIFAGSGVGKSTLLGMIARNTTADVNVIALIGERGREVKEFIERDLGEEGIKRSVVVVVTSDQSSLLRIKGAEVATALAEYFRDLGLDVMLMMDSVTRYAMAAREVGLAIGEPPATKGYTPSVFAKLPKLLERSGTNSKGSITAFYTVLVDSDDMNEPIADAVRGILDGHIVLSRDLANKGQFPAIDILASVSRLMKEITDEEHQKAAQNFKQLLATYRNSEDLINIGAYRKGSNKEIDLAISNRTKMIKYLTQGMNEKPDFTETISQLKAEFLEVN